MLRVAVLEGPTPDPGLAGLLAERPGLEVEETGSVEGLIALAPASGFDAAVIDPDLPEGWPADIAARVADELGAFLPLVLVCRPARDVVLLEERTRGLGGVTVLPRERLAAGDLEDVLRGEATKRRISGGLGRPS